MSATADHDLNERIIAVSRLIGSFFESADQEDLERDLASDLNSLDDPFLIVEDRPGDGPAFAQSQN